MGPIPSALEPIRIIVRGSQGPIRKEIILNLDQFPMYSSVKKSDSNWMELIPNGKP